MGAVEKPRTEVAPPASWDYAPSLEGREIVSLERRYGLYIGGEHVSPRSRSWFTTISPSTEEPLAEVAQAGQKDVALAVGAAREAFRTWSRRKPSERAKVLFRIARVLQERARELAVAESLDGGKPIKESRDVDLPLAAAHFFYYAGWADKLEYAFPGRTPKPLGVAAQIVPWNFPLLMLSWKIAPALACGNTVVLKPAETTPLTALLFADVCRQAEVPPGVVNIVTGDGSTGAYLVEGRGDRQGRVHRLDRGRQGDPARARGAGRLAHARARRQGGEHRVRRLRARPGGRRDRQRDLLQPGARVLRGFASPGAGVDPRPARTEAQAPHGDAPGRESARQEHRRRRDQLERPARADLGARAERDRRGRGALPAAVPVPGEGLVVRPDGVHECRAEPPHRTGGDLRPGAQRAHLPDAGRGGREGEQHDVRALRRRLDGEGVADPVDGRPAARGRRLGEHVQPLRPVVALRRLQGVRVRPRGRAPRARAVPEVRSERPASRPQDVQALRRRRVPALGVRSHARGRGVQHRAGVAEGRPGGGRRGPQGGCRLERRDRVQPRPGPLPARGDDGDAHRCARRRVERTT